jgi:large subunit ribosomal protein L6
MSRIGKQPITLPKGVEMTVSGKQLTCKGPLGSLSLGVHDVVDASVADGVVTITRKDDEKFTRAMHGTTRALIAGMVEGVTTGYKKALEVVGVGYKAQIKGTVINLDVGFANTISVEIPKGVKVEVADSTKINVSGIDKQAVHQTAAAIRAVRKPEPYKGKGIKYSDETVRRKAGKSAAGGAKK